MDDITIENASNVQAWLSSLVTSLQSNLLDKASAIADALKQKVSDKLSGEVLNEKSGALKNSLDSDVTQNDNTISGSVSVGSDVPYAAIQEYGGVTKAHIIMATNSKFLAFNAGGKEVFAKYINHPGSVIPERSYLRSSLSDMSDDITNEISETFQETINIT